VDTHLELTYLRRRNTSLVSSTLKKKMKGLNSVNIHTLWVFAAASRRIGAWRGSLRFPLGRRLGQPKVAARPAFDERSQPLAVKRFAL
jgi:hypothetical protein